MRGWGWGVIKLLTLGDMRVGVQEGPELDYGINEQPPYCYNTYFDLFRNYQVPDGQAQEDEEEELDCRAVGSCAGLPASLTKYFFQSQFLDIRR